MTLEDFDAGEYCHEVEAYLCRKNDGHLIRLAGPSFTRVCGWAAQGIPLNAVYRGIDRFFERYYAKGPRRRPVQIDYCEADVLDVFDEWRRAVGVFDHAQPEAAARAPRLGTLPAHLERIITRLTTMRAGGRFSAGADRMLDGVVRELDAARGGAAHARGEGRAAIVARLAALDGQLVAEMRRALTDADWRAVEDSARADLARFKDTMSPEAYDRAFTASATRLLRERTGLPDLRYEE